MWYSSLYGKHIYHSQATDVRNLSVCTVKPRLQDIHDSKGCSLYKLRVIASEHRTKFIRFLESNDFLFLDIGDWGCVWNCHINGGLWRQAFLRFFDVDISVWTDNSSRYFFFMSWKHYTLTKKIITSLCQVIKFLYNWRTLLIKASRVHRRQ